MKQLSITLMMLFSVAALADIVEPLPKSDSFAKTARAIATQLSDGNISTGETTLWVGELKGSGRFKTKDEFEKLVLQGFKLALKDRQDIDLPESTKLVVSVGKFVDGDEKNGDVHKMTAALIESNAYNTENKEIWNSSARYIWAVLRKFPVSEKTLFGHVKAKVKNTVSGQGTRTVQYFLLVNNDKKAIQFFTAEGDM